MIRFLRFKEVQARTGLSRATINRRIAAGKFPKPVPLDSPHTVGFLESEISEYCESLLRAARPERSVA